MDPAQSRIATFIGCIAIGLWSLLALLTAASGAMPPFQLAAITFTIGGCVGLIAIGWRGNLVALRQPWQAWCLGVGGLFGYHALYFAALRLAPPAQAGLIAYLWPLLIVLFSAFLPGDRLQTRHILGALTGFSGVAILLLARGETLAFTPQIARGFMLAFLSAFVWAIYSVLSRKFSHVPSEAIAGFCLATAALAGLAHFVWEKNVWPTQTSQWLAVVGLGLGPVGLAFYVWDHGVKHGDIRWLGVASYAAPVLSTLILVHFGYAQANWALGAACFMIVSGAWIAAKTRKTPANAEV